MKFDLAGLGGKKVTQFTMFLLHLHVLYVAAFDVKSSHVLYCTRPIGPVCATNIAVAFIVLM